MTSQLDKHEWSDDNSKPIYDVVSTSDSHSDSYADADSCDDWGEHPSRRSPEPSEHASDRDFIDDEPLPLPVDEDQYANKFPCMLTAEEVDFIHELRLARKCQKNWADDNMFRTMLHDFLAEQMGFTHSILAWRRDHLVAESKTVNCRVLPERKSVPSYNPWPEVDLEDIESEELCDTDEDRCKSPLISATSPAARPQSPGPAATPVRRKFRPPTPTVRPIKRRLKCYTPFGECYASCIPPPANQMEAFNIHAFDDLDDCSFRMCQQHRNWQELTEAASAKKRKVSVDTSDWDKLSTM